MTIVNQNNQSANPADWKTFYADLQNQGHIPDASTSSISDNTAVFRDMYLDLSVIKESIRTSGKTPIMTTIYADVLVIPDLTNWLLQAEGLVIIARRIEVSGSASVILDYSQSTSGQVIVFAREMTGTLTVLASKSSGEQPTKFSIDQTNIAPGISISINSDKPTSKVLSLTQGFGFQTAEDMQLYLDNAFIYGSLLYDQNEALALSLFLWTKAWAAEKKEMAGLFYRSTSLSTLLNSERNAKANGAAFVPYLTSDIYTDLAGAFADYAAKYESDYMALNTQKVLTEENIVTAKTMVANADSEVAYVQALLKQANENYDNAIAAVTKANANFNTQQTAVDMVAIDFQKIGIPEYERKEIVKAIFSLVTAIVTFGAAIALMAVGDEAAAPAAAEGAVAGAEAVAGAAKTGVEIAKMAKELAEVMKELKKLVEVLKKVYELAKSVKEAADNIGDATSQMGSINKLKDATDGADLSAADTWAIFNIKVDNILKTPIEKDIEYASSYKEALNILVVYGQSLAAGQLAVIKASQQAAAITFQLHYTQQKQSNLQKLVDQLKVGEAPILSMMQQFYQKYLDGKSNLFTALKNYRASYFYWALQQSSIQPKIVDSVKDLNAGIEDITKLQLDKANALSRFDPPPQEMGNTLFEVTNSKVLQTLQKTGECTWILPLDDAEFAGLNRVRLDTIRVWLEGVVPGSNDSVFMTITNTGNYLDRYKSTNYQFNSKSLTRTFKYRMAKTGENPDWDFANGELGFVQIDGAVDKEVAYAYFEPTPFSEWKITLLANNPGLDYSKVSKITMFFEGSAIGSTSAARELLTSKHKAHA